MQVLLGIIFHFTGGFASGSFYLPYKKVESWAWESYWLLGGLFSWLIIPPLIALLTVPSFAEIIGNAAPSVLFYVILFGILWGIGGLTYGLAVRYLGLSLGNSIALSCCSFFGALIPAVYYNFFPQEDKTSFSQLLQTSWGQIVLLGLALSLLGIYICGRAGASKEKELKGTASGAESFQLTKGLLVAVCSGLLSACFNFGIEAGKPLADAAVAAGYNPLYQNNVTYVVLLWGGLTTNLIWCLLLSIRNRSYRNYTDAQTPLLKNYLLSALAGTLWFLQFFFYGMGESKLGNGASSWILHMAFIILIANFWGFALKEWQGVSSRTRNLIIAGVLTILASVVVVGWGNYIKQT